MLRGPEGRDTETSEVGIVLILEERLACFGRIGCIKMSRRGQSPRGGGEEERCTEAVGLAATWVAGISGRALWTSCG